MSVVGSGPGFAGFLPSFLLRRLEDRGSLPDTVTAHPIQAVVLFVDIVGFTSLTDQLASEGRHGTEATSGILNRALDPLVEESLSRGGDLVVFAGDAVILIWPFEDAAQRQRAVQSAAASALAIVRSSSPDAQPAPDDEHVRMRAAVGLGDLTGVEVGGHDGQWRFLVEGPGILDAIRADRHSRPGRVVLSPEAHEAAGPLCRGTVIGDGLLDLETIESGAFPAPRPDPVSAFVSRSLAPAFVPRAAVDRIRAGHGAWLAEFRRLAVLFIHLDSDDSSGLVPVSTLQTATTAAQALLARYDGELYGTLFDDKGTVLIGLFGLPHQAHENITERAALTAMDLKQAMSHAAVETSIGITLGLAYCGLYGAGLRQQYMVVGSVMNLAARLMTKATNAILCDADAAVGLASSGRIEAVPAGVLTLKGKSRPVEVFALALTGDSTSSSDESGEVQMVGRDEEFESLRTLLSGVGRPGVGTLALIEGEAGAGKSLLAREVLAAARDHGLDGRIGRASDVERTTPYYPWRTIVGDLLGTRLAENETIEDRLRSMGLTEELARAGPVLGPLLPTEIPDNDWTHALTWDARAEARHRLIVALFGAGPRRPPVLWLDDVHLMDSASWTVLEELLRAPLGALVLATTRPTPDLPVFDWPGDLPFHRIELSGLSPASQRRLIETTLGAKRVDDTLVSWIASRSGGNPFFVEQLALELREAGAVQMRGEVATFADEGALGLDAKQDSRSAPSVEAVITSRVDALSVNAQLTLKLLSVIDQPTDESAVSLIHPTHPAIATLPAQIAELELRGFIERDTLRGRVNLRHALIREAVYGSIPFALRRDLHEGIASWLESKLGVAGFQEHPALAYHWLGAERPDRALPHLARAGEAALAVFANVEAVEFFSKAIDVAEHTSGDTNTVDPSRLGTWRVGMGRAYTHLQHYSEGVRELSLGLNLLGERLPESSVGLSLSGIGALCRHLILRAMGRAPRLPSDAIRGELLWRSRAYESLMEASYVTGDPPRSLVSALRALNRAYAAGPSPELARGYATVGAMMSFIPLRGVARGYWARALATANDVGDPAARAWVELTVGVYHAGRAEWNAAIELLAEASDLALGVGDRRRWVDCQAQLAQVHLMRGDLTRAVAQMTEALASASQGQTAGAEVLPRHADQFLRVQAHVRLALGDVDQAAGALRLFRDAIEKRSVKDGLTTATIAALEVGIRCATLDQEPEAETVEILDAALGLPFAPIPFCTLEFEAIAASLGGRLGSSAAVGARKNLLKTVGRHARVFAVSRPVAMILRAGLDARLSRDARIRSLHEAAALSNQLGRPLVEGTALLHLARLHSRNDPDRARSLHAAARLFDEAGARLLRERVQIEIEAG